MAKLTPQQAIFVGEYLLFGKGTRAAIAAGVPAKSAHTAASRWLKNPKIAAAIEERRARVDEKYDVKIGRTLRKLAEIATGMWSTSSTTTAIHCLCNE